MNSERAISSARRQGCLRSRKAALRRRSRNEEGKVAPFQRGREEAGRKGGRKRADVTRNDGARTVEKNESGGKARVEGR